MNYSGRNTELLGRRVNLNRLLVLSGWLFVMAWLVLGALPASAGLTNNIADRKDEACDHSPGGAGAPPRGACPPCAGMATWWVTEPYINLWIADEPLGYTTSHGESMSFRWMYRQRFERPPELGTSDYNAPSRTRGMTNAAWGHSWLSHIQFWDETWDANPLPFPFRPTYANWKAVVVLPEGAFRIVSVSDTAEGRSHDRLEPLRGVGQTPFSFSDVGFALCNPTATNGFRLIHPDGSQDIYNLVRKVYADGFQESVCQAFLTARVDAFGRTNRVCYWEGTTPYRVKHVVDYDGRTNTFRYDHPTFSELVTEVEDPYGRLAQFNYHTNGVLTNIVDTAGLSSSFKYELPGTNSWITKLITPYGTNSFAFYEAPTEQFGFLQGNLGGHDRINRSVEITAPDGSKQLYLYRYDSPGLFSTNFPANEVPNVSGATLDNGTATDGGARASIHFRNSFYWGPKQYAALSTTVHDSFTTADYRKARWRHWLAIDDLFVSDRISIERDPSTEAQGSVAGAKTWFDYDGKGSGTHRVGTESLIGLIAQVLPDGTTTYKKYSYVPVGSVGSGRMYRTDETHTRPDGSTGVRSVAFEYYSNGIDLYRVWAPDDDGNATVLKATFTYNANHQITTYVNGVSETLTFDHDLDTRKLTSVSTPSGLNTVLFYYPLDLATYGHNAGFLETIFDAEIVASNSFTYANGLVRTNTDPRGLTTTYTWDGLQRLTSVSFPDQSFISNRYDKLDLSATRDRLGNWTSFGHDALRHLTAITNAANNVTRLGWCGCGSLETITNALTNVTTFVYDNQLRRTDTLYPDGSSLTYRFDLLGRLTNVLDGASRSLKLAYNNQGLLSAVSNAFGRALGVVYDVQDRPIRVTDAAGVTVTNTFDNADRLLTRLWPDNGVERFLYTNGLLVAYSNQLNRATRFNYDPAARLLAVTNANLEITRFSYNAAGDLRTLTDGNTHLTTWNYDEFGRATNKLDHLGNVAFTNAYDANDRLTKRWTPAKGLTTYDYDPLNNLTNIDYALSPDIRLAYDALNRLTNVVTVGLFTNLFTYTPIGQLQSEDGPWADDTVSYGYTGQQRTSLTLLQPNAAAWTQTYGYDDARRLQTLTSPAGTFTYDYHVGQTISPASLVRTLTLPNAAWITNHYDGLGRRDYTALVNRWGHVLDGYAYAHDSLGLRTNVTRDLGLTTNSLAYAYDGIGQLQVAKAYEPDGVTLRLNEQRGYAYDPANNLSRRTNNAFIQTFNTDARNQLSTATRAGTFTVDGSIERPVSSVTVNGQSAARYTDGTFAAQGFTLNNGANTFTVIAQATTGQSATNALNLNLPATVTFQYDLNGNLVSDGQRSFEYDDENQLTNVYVANAWRTEFKYDGFGRRRIQKEFGWIAGAWSQTNETRFVYDGSLVIQERDGSNVPRLTLTRGLDFSGTRQGAGGIGGLLARTDSSGSAFFHADGSGNVTALTDSKQNIVARYLYDPFGNLLARSGALADANRYRFSSKEVHPLSGLYYYGGRYYEPNFQRWVNADPIGELGGINLHRFVYNDPVNRIDPLGLDYRYSTDAYILGLIPAPSGYVPYVFGDTVGENIVSQVNNIGYLIHNATFHTLQNIDIATEWVENQLGGPGSLMAIPFVAGERSAVSSISKMSRVVECGKQGEIAAGIVKNTERIESLTKTASYRIPDVLNKTEKIIGEAKNREYIAMTAQLRDDLAFAQKFGYTFQLSIPAGPNVYLTTSVRNAVASGQITLQYFVKP